MATEAQRTRQRAWREAHLEAARAREAGVKRRGRATSEEAPADVPHTLNPDGALEGEQEVQDAGRSHRRALGTGTYHTLRGGGTGRAWVLCPCDACAHLHRSRTQDGERGTPHARHWRRIENAPPNWREPCD